MWMGVRKIILWAVEAVSTGADLLLSAETDGVAFDFTDMSAAVKDTTTPSNNFSGDPNDLVTYSSPSAKQITGSDGLLQSGSTLRTNHDASGNPLGILVEGARTNLCLHANDLTNAAYTKSNMSTAKTATGPDGEANSATIITADAANATVLQAITSASAERITSVYLKRRTGSGNIDLTQDNGSTWATQSVTSTWARFNLSAVTSANPTVGLRVVTSGDEVDVALFQHELGAFITSPILTVAATVTRAVDNITLLMSATPLPDMTTTGDAMSMFIQTKLPPSGKSGDDSMILAIDDGSNQDRINLLNSSSNAWRLFCQTSGGDDVSIVHGSLAAEATLRVACRCIEDDYKFSVEGEAQDSDTSADLFGDALLNIRIGTSHAGGVPADSSITKISIAPRAKSDAELENEAGN